MMLEISREEYGALLDLLSIAESVLTDHKSGLDPGTRVYEEIIQKWYARAEESGHGGKVTYDSELGKYVPATKREASAARRLLDEFSDETFWHELIYRFTERDLDRQARGREKTRALGQEELFDLETSIEERYLAEFEEHGIERLEVVERFGMNGMRSETSD